MDYSIDQIFEGIVLIISAIGNVLQAYWRRNDTKVVADYMQMYMGKPPIKGKDK